LALGIRGLVLLASLLALFRTLASTRLYMGGCLVTVDRPVLALALVPEPVAELELAPALRLAPTLRTGVADLIGGRSATATFLLHGGAGLLTALLLAPGLPPVLSSGVLLAREAAAKPDGRLAQSEGTRLQYLTFVLSALSLLNLSVSLLIPGPATEARATVAAAPPPSSVAGIDFRARLSGTAHSVPSVDGLEPSNERAIRLFPPNCVILLVTGVSSSPVPIPVVTPMTASASAFAFADSGSARGGAPRLAWCGSVALLLFAAVAFRRVGGLVANSICGDRGSTAASSVAMAGFVAASDDLGESTHTDLVSSQASF
jgi:hypothetical protein